MFPIIIHVCIHVKNVNKSVRSSSHSVIRTRSGLFGSWPEKIFTYMWRGPYIHAGGHTIPVIYKVRGDHEIPILYKVWGSYKT